MSRDEELIARIFQENPTLIERFDSKSLIMINEYADKVERFIDMWREELISDVELVKVINDLTRKVVVIDNNYAVHIEPPKREK